MIITVPIPGTAVPLTPNVRHRGGFLVTALPGNTGLIAVGREPDVPLPLHELPDQIELDTGPVATSGAENGKLLAASDHIWVPGPNSAEHWIDAEVADEGVTFERM